MTCMLTGVNARCMLTCVNAGCMLTGVNGRCVLTGVNGRCVLTGVNNRCVLTGVNDRCVLTGARLGLYASGAMALSGEELDSMDIGQLCRIIGQVGVFYRTTPRHKLKIVKVSGSLSL